MSPTAVSDSPAPTTRLSTLEVSPGVSIFYRTAGSPSSPTVLLLHGFPTSSHQYRHLIPLLAQSYHVVAPDLPGFGFTSIASSTAYQYTFASLAETISQFVVALGLDQKGFAMYVFDYGAPVGFRLALKHPGSVTAVVTQNGNAYVEGLGPGWAVVRPLWESDTPENRRAVADAVLSLAATKSQYVDGVTDAERLSQIEPEGYYLDAALMARPGNDKIQVDLFRDYRTNVEMYPRFQEWIRSSGVRVLAVWGANDPFFIPEGAKAYARDARDAEVVLLEDAGHFALESHLEEVADRMLAFLGGRARRYSRVGCSGAHTES